jgi:hypothetical protein
MAIKDESTGNGAEVQNNPTGSFAPNRDHQTKADSTGYSFTNLRKLSRPAFSRTQASEALNKITKAMTEMITEKADKSFEINLVPIEKEQTPNLSISILILAVRDKQNPLLGVAYHSLLLEASADIRTPKPEMINGQSVEILYTAGDSCNDTLKGVVLGYVQRLFPQDTPRNAGACVVPKDFNVEDKSALHVLIANAIFACTSELEINSKNFEDINIANAKNDSTLSVRTQFAMPQQQDAVGAPLRSDIVLDFTAAPVQSQQTQQQDAGREAPIARIGGFLDIFWDPIVAPQNLYGIPDPTQQSFQRYAARFVATTMESTELLTIPAQLLALVPVVGLGENNAWVQGFRPRDFPSGDVDFRDIGAIGIEVNFSNDPSGVGQRIDTHADKFKPENLGQLVKATIRPGLVVSLDVPECGAQTWFNEVFSAAAAGNTQANIAILKAANELTNGNFGKYFDPKGRVATDEYNRIHLGHYTNSRGERADIRDIDYLAVLNCVGAQDPGAIKLWSDSFASTHIPLPKRLYERKRIIQSICNNAVFTGYARRVTFEVGFINALVKGCQEAGLVLKPVYSYQDLGNYERARSQFSGHTLLTPESSGIFRSGYNQNATPSGANRGFSRWQ